jgi:hypothetical protein
VNRRSHRPFRDTLPSDRIDHNIAQAVKGIKGDHGFGWPAKPIDVARVLYSNRRARNRHFDNSLFAEPRWDILLDLFIAGEEGRSISVSSACIGAAVPNATALRHLAAMQRKGLVERRAHPRDARCQQVRISDTAAASMCDLFADLKAGSSPRAALSLSGRHV